MKSFLETWRPVVGYDGLYEVSNFGDVRSLGMFKRNGKGTYFQECRILKTWKDKRGYLHVSLSKDGKRKRHLVHRLVAKAFIPNSYNLPEVNHIDEVKTNNVVSNLEWCTTKYNCNYGTHNKRIAETLRNNPKISDIVLQMTLDYTLVKEWPSVNECGRNGFCQQCIFLCCWNKYGLQKNVYNGCRWGYKKNYSIAKILSEYSCQSCL